MSLPLRLLVASALMSAAGFVSAEETVPGYKKASDNSLFWQVAGQAGFRLAISVNLLGKCDQVLFSAPVKGASGSKQYRLYAYRCAHPDGERYFLRYPGSDTKDSWVDAATAKERLAGRSYCAVNFKRNVRDFVVEQGDFYMFSACEGGGVCKTSADNELKLQTNFMYKKGQAEDEMPLSAAPVLTFSIVIDGLKTSEITVADVHAQLETNEGPPLLETWVHNAQKAETDAISR